jgi:hypothetical protein
VPAPLHVINLFHTPAPVQIMNVFDTNGDGEVDFQEFRDIVGKLLLPGAMMLRFYLSLRHLGCAASAARPRLPGNRRTHKLWSPHVDSDACA